MKTQGAMHAPAKKRRILIADDQPLVRERLVQLISQEEDVAVCGEAADAAQTLRAVDVLNPDLLIVEIAMQGNGGTGLLRDIQAHQVRTPVLVFSHCDESLYGARCIRAGARGYVNKRETAKGIMQAIRRVLQGSVHASESVKEELLRQAATGWPARGNTGPDALSDREWEVFRRLGLGDGPHKIAEELHLSNKTVEGYMGRIKLKLGLKDAHELHRWAIEQVKLAEIAALSSATTLPYVHPRLHPPS